MNERVAAPFLPCRNRGLEQQIPDCHNLADPESPPVKPCLQTVPPPALTLFEGGVPSSQPSTCPVCKCQRQSLQGWSPHLSLLARRLPWSPARHFAQHCSAFPAVAEVLHSSHTTAKMSVCLQAVGARCSTDLHAVKPCTAVTKQQAPMCHLHWVQGLPHSAEAWHVPAPQEDPELKPLFEKAQKGGMQAVMALMSDQQFLQKIGEKMGDIPEVAVPTSADPAAAAPEVNNLLDAAK